MDDRDAVYLALETQTISAVGRTTWPRPARFPPIVEQAIFRASACAEAVTVSKCATEDSSKLNFYLPPLTLFYTGFYLSPYSRGHRDGFRLSHRVQGRRS